MKKLILTAVKYLPLPEEDEPGMPSFEICGSLDGIPYAGTLSLEIEGRDAEYEPVMGPPSEEITGPGDDIEGGLDIYALLGDFPAWEEGRAAHDARYEAQS